MFTPCGRWVNGRIEGDPFDVHEKKGHSERAAVFSDWLLTQFGVDRISARHGVLDVAGGRGDLAFELAAKRGVPTTVNRPALPLQRTSMSCHR
jgi:hypothetical protein